MCSSRSHAKSHTFQLPVIRGLDRALPVRGDRHRIDYTGVAGNVSTTSTYYIKTVPAQVTHAMEKLQEAIPETLSGNEVATRASETTAAPGVN